jgi:hypothetical protein
MTQSSDFPTLNASQASLNGASDAFVTKLNPAGTALIYSTYLGGSGNEGANAIAINPSGEAYVAGKTESDDFPVTASAFQRRKGYPTTTVTNGFVSKLSSDGTTLAYSSFLGGTWCSICRSAYYDNDAALSLTVDAAGYAYVGGRARSPAFPQVDPIQDTVERGDGEGAWPFLAKVTPHGDALVYSILIGENGSYDKSLLAIALDGAGNVHALGDTDYNSASTHPTTKGAWLTANAANAGRFLLKMGVPNYPSSVTSSQNPAAANTLLTFKARVQSLKAGGTVTFFDGTATLGSVAVDGGTASLDVTLPAGVHKITAVNSDDGKVSLPIFQVINN